MGGGGDLSSSIEMTRPLLVAEEPHGKAGPATDEPQSLFMVQPPAGQHEPPRATSYTAAMHGLTGQPPFQPAVGAAQQQQPPPPSQQHPGVQAPPLPRPPQRPASLIPMPAQMATPRTMETPQHAPQFRPPQMMPMPMPMSIVMPMPMTVAGMPPNPSLPEFSPSVQQPPPSIVDTTPTPSAQREPPPPPLVERLVAQEAKLFDDNDSSGLEELNSFLKELALDEQPAGNEASPAQHEEPHNQYQQQQQHQQQHIPAVKQVPPIGSISPPESMFTVGNSANGSTMQEAPQMNKVFYV